MNSSTMVPAPMASSVAVPRRGRWLHRAVWLVLASLALSVLTLLSVLGDVLPAPLDITINGTSVASGLDLAVLPAAHKLALAVVVAVALLAALVLTLAVIVVAAVALVPVLLLAVGLPVLVAGVVLARPLLAPRAARLGLVAGAQATAGRYDDRMNSSNNAAAARAVLADDERLMREQMRARLAEVWPELEIVAEAKNGLEAVQAVREHQPDIVFLDIRMPGLTGVEAARQIAQLEFDDDALLPEIVFVTAYDQYAIEAFEQGVADYVLKPAERERLALTVERLKKRLATRGTADAQATAPIQQLLHKLSTQLNPSGAAGYLQWIQASVGSTIQMIPVADVLFFISDEKYTRVQTAQLEALIRKPIKELVDEVDPQLFWQIHRSTLVNVNAVSGVARDFRGRQIVGVKGHPEKLEVSRSYAGLFKGM